MRAAEWGQLAIVKALVEAGASIGARTSTGRTSLTIIQIRKDQVYDFLRQVGTT